MNYTCNEEVQQKEYLTKGTKKFSQEIKRFGWENSERVDQY